MAAERDTVAAKKDSSDASVAMSARNVSPVLDPELNDALRTLESIVQRDVSAGEGESDPAAPGNSALSGAAGPRLGPPRAPRKRRWIAAAELFAIATVLAALLFAGRLLGPQLELRAEIGGVEAPLEGSRLCLGPRRDHATVRVLGLDASSPIESVRLVSGAHPAAPAVAGFIAIVEKDGEVVIRRSLEELPGSKVAACLEVSRAGAETAWSAPFDVAWIDESAWTLESVAIDGLGRRALDPYDAVLEIAVRGDRANLAGVRVDHDGVPFPALRDVARSHGDHNVYLLPLRSLDLACGATDLRVVVTDLAHRTAESIVTARCVSGPLTLDRVELDSTPVGGLYFVPPHDDRRLRVVASRKCDLAWTVRDETGAALMTGAAEAVGEGTYLLAGLPKLAGGKGFQGTIDVEADENAYVLHARSSSRGVAKRQLRFSCAPSSP